MPTVTVDIPNTPQYDVVVECNALHSAGPRLAQLFQNKKAAIVTDDKAGGHWLKSLTDSLASAGITPVVATFSGGEDHKTLDSVSEIFDQLLPHKLDRKTPLIALGGGIVGDVGGFVAGTLLRGVPLVQLPTTLLAMVDASVGGKTGVNHAAGKNLIGVFHQPSLVVIDPQTLRTLPAEELRGGLAECIKHDVIRDATGFAVLEKNIHRIFALDMDYLVELIAHNVAIKARVVEEDPLEHGVRAHLNLGHTFGHALEKVSAHQLSHGQAVAVGIQMATELARRLTLIDEASCRRVTALIDSVGFSGKCGRLPAEQILDAMFFDKKVADGKLRLVLPEQIGKVVIRDDVPLELIRQTLQAFEHRWP